MYRGSRRHVLDWIEEDDFVSSLNAMIAVTGMTVALGGNRMPRNSVDNDEARLGIQCAGLISESVNKDILDWWLVKHRNANVPNWDLACAATTSDDRAGLVLMEAKAHVAEFVYERKGKAPGDAINHSRITAAINEARSALSVDVPGVNISSHEWYQLANRVAFAWKLASIGIPTTLVYIGFTGDSGVGKALMGHEHWRETVLEASAVLPATVWERRIDCPAAPLWLLIRSKPCSSPTPVLPRVRPLSKRPGRSSAAPARVVSGLDSGVPLTVRLTPGW